MSILNQHLGIWFVDVDIEDNVSLLQKCVTKNKDNHEFRITKIRL